MNTITLSTARLVDIVSPQNHATIYGYSFACIIITALILTVVYVILWKRHHSKPQINLRQLKHIQHDLTAQRLTPKMACYKIAAIYKKHLGLTHLPDKCILPVALSTQQSVWNHHLQRLYTLRYSGQRCSEQEVKKLVTETRYWLKQWP